MVFPGRPSSLRSFFSLFLPLALLLPSFLISNAPIARAQSYGEAPSVKTDRRFYAEPSLPALPHAGGKWRDAVFGSEIMRATDEADYPAPGLGTYYSHWPTFNADSTRLLIRKGVNGAAMIKRFDPVGFELLGAERAQMPQLPRGSSANWEGATWHHSDPDVIFTHASYASPDYSDSGMKLYEYRVSTNSFALIKDFSSLTSTPGKDYLGQMYVSADSDVFCFLHKRVGSDVVGYLVWRRSDDRMLAFVPNSYPQGINEVHVDKTGRWLYVSLNDCSATGCVRQIVRDLETGQETNITRDAQGRPTGHGDLGGGSIMGFDGYHNSIHVRRFDDPLRPQNVFYFKTEDGQNDWTYDFHGSLLADNNDWITIGTYDIPGTGLPEHHLLEDEIVQVATDGSGRVRRLAHTRTVVDNRTDSTNYWAAPKPTVSRDGRYIAFTSNWENSGRYDLFILRAEHAVQTQPTPTPTPIATPTPTPTPISTPTPTPTPISIPTPTPTPLPDPGSSRETVSRTKWHAQEVSNDISAAYGAAPPAAGQTSGPALGTNVAQSAAPVISGLVTEIETSHSHFLSDQNSYPAAVRIDAALLGAVGHARSAETLAQQGQFFELKSELRRAIDKLELAHTLMSYGDIPDPLVAPEFFVRQQYVDFLDREPDTEGFNFWLGQITSCGANQSCVEARRVNVSAAFYLSIENQETGYLVHRAHKVTFGRSPSMSAFESDEQILTRGVIVGVPGWKERLEANTQGFLEDWVQRASFRTLYGGMQDAPFIDALIANSGANISRAERDHILSELERTSSRAHAMRLVLSNTEFVRAEKSAAFVLTQYFGYLRRDPDEVGYNFWLKKLNDHGGDFQKAEMVRSFLVSSEYTRRFRQQ